MTLNQLNLLRSYCACHTKRKCTVEVCWTVLIIIWKNEVTIMLHHQLFSTHYAAVYTSQQLFEKNHCNQSSHYEINFCYEWKPSHAYQKIQWHFLWWAKMNGTQRRSLVSLQRMQCMYSDMAKGISRAEVKSNKINPI